MRFINALSMLVAATCVAGAALAGETKTFVDLQIGAGYDTNGLRLHGAGREAAYGELLASTGVRGRLGHRFELFTEASGRERVYESASEDAGSTTGGLRMGARITANPRSRHRLTLSVGGSYHVNRYTFTDRTTGEVYEVGVDPPTVPATTTPIPKRYDNDVQGAFLDINWKVGRNVYLSLDTRLEDARYAEDYATNTSLDPLDYRALTLRPGIRFRLSPLVALGLWAVYTDLNYDAQPALNENGFSVLGTQRAYDYLDYRMTLRLTPVERLHLDVGLRGGARDDLYAGYYDFDSQAGYVSLEYRPGTRARLSLSASQSDLDYDRAVVPDSVNDQTRSSDVRRYVGSLAWKTGSAFELIVEGGSQQTDSTDPIYAYDRDWVFTGVRIIANHTSGNK